MGWFAWAERNCGLRLRSAHNIEAYNIETNNTCVSPH